MKKLFFMLLIVGLFLITSCKKSEPTEILVKFNSNGGSEVSAISKKSELDFDHLPIPTKEGYTFVGWYIDEELTKDVNSNKPKTLQLTLYAKWSINSYTIHFDSNGGTDVSNITDEYNTFVSLPTPTRESHIFQGWCLTSALNNPVHSINIPSSNITLYAKWEEIVYQVTFETNEGSTVDSQVVVVNHSASIPTPPSKTGYAFAGWFTDTDLTNLFDFSTPIANDITLYAKWQIKQFTISFISNAEITVTSITAEYNRTISAPEDPIRTGYTFLGWYQDEALTTPFVFDKMPAENITLYAKWLAGSSKLYFNANGGSTVDTITAEIDSVVSPPDTPAKKGYEFVGWYTDALCTIAFSWVMPVHDITLYAKWIPAEYTITFDSMGGSSVSNITGTYLSPVTKPDSPTRAGYFFDGWYTDPELSTLFTFDHMPATDMTLYASWIDLSEGMPISYIKTKEVYAPIVTKGYVISALGDSYLGFYIADDTGAIFVHYDQSLVSLGDEVSFAGNYTLINGVPQLINIYDFVIESHDSILEPSVDLTVQAINELDESDLDNYATFIRTTGILIDHDGFYYLDDGLGNQVKISHYSYTTENCGILDSLLNQSVELDIVLHDYDDVTHSWIVTYQFDSLHAIPLSDAERLSIIEASIINTYQDNYYRPNDIFVIPSNDQFSWSTISYEATGSHANLYNDTTKQFIDSGTDTTVDFLVSISIGSESKAITITVHLACSVSTIEEFINIEDDHDHAIIATVIFLSYYEGYSILQDDTGTIMVNNTNYLIGDNVKITAQKSTYNDLVYIDTATIKETILLSSNNNFNHAPTNFTLEQFSQLDKTDASIYGKYIEIRGFLKFDPENYEYYLYNDEYSYGIYIGSENAEGVLDYYSGLEVILRGYIDYINDEPTIIFYGYRNELTIPQYTDEALVSILQKLFIQEYGGKVFYPYDTFELSPFHKVLGGNISWSFSNETQSLINPDTNAFIEVEISTPVQINVVIESHQAELAFTYNTTLEPFQISTSEALNDLEPYTFTYITGIVIYHNYDYTYILHEGSIIKIDGEIPAFTGDEVLVKVYSDYSDYEHVTYIDRYDFFFKVKSRYNPYQLNASDITIEDFYQYTETNDDFYNEYIEVTGQLKTINGNLILSDGIFEIQIDTCDGYTRGNLAEYLDQDIKIKAYVKGYDAYSNMWSIYYTGLDGEFDVITHTDEEKQTIIQDYLTEAYQKIFKGDSCVTFITSHPFIESTISYTPQGEYANYIDIESEYIYNVSHEIQVPIEITVMINDTTNIFTILLTIVPSDSSTNIITTIEEFKHSNGEPLTVQGVIISIGNGYFLIQDETGRIFVETDSYSLTSIYGDLVEITGKLTYDDGRLQIAKDYELTIVSINQIPLILYPETPLADIVKYDFYDASQYGKSVTITGEVKYKVNEYYQSYYYITDGYDEVMIDGIQSYRLYQYLGLDVTLRGFVYGVKPEYNNAMWVVNVMNTSPSLINYPSIDLIDYIGEGIVEEFNDQTYDSYSTFYFPLENSLITDADIIYQVLNDENQVIDLNNGMIWAVEDDTSFNIKVTITLNDISKDFFFTIHVRETTGITVDQLEGIFGLPYDVVSTKVHYFYGTLGTKYFIANGNVFILHDYYYSSYGISEGDFVYLNGVKTILDNHGGFGYEIAMTNAQEYSEDFAIVPTTMSISEIYQTNLETIDLTEKYLKVYGQLLYDEHMEMYYIQDEDYKLYIRTTINEEMRLMSYYDSNLENYLYNTVYIKVLFPNITVRGDYYLVDYKSTDSSITYPNLTALERVMATFSNLEYRYSGNVYNPADSLWLPTSHYDYGTTISWTENSDYFEDNNFLYVDSYTAVPFDVTVTYEALDEYYTYTETITVYINPPTISPILEAVRGYNDETYTIQGVVIAFDTWDYWTYVKDDTGIILINNCFEGVEVGDEIIVFGERNNLYWGNAPYLDAYANNLLKILSHNNTITDETPTVLTLNEFNQLDYMYPEDYGQKVTVTGIVHKVSYSNYILECDGFTINIDFMITDSYDGKAVLEQLIGDEIEYTGYLSGFETIYSTSHWMVTFSGQPTSYHVLTDS